MKINLLALLSGIVFGFGLALSHMVDPHKVIAFLDIVDTWDPSLALVMGGGLLVTGIGFPLVRGRGRPWLDTEFHVPSQRNIDVRLLAGSALFGLGWGLAGYCPGPGIAAFAINPHEAAVFVPAMILGGLLMRALTSMRREQIEGAPGAPDS